MTAMQFIYSMPVFRAHWDFRPPKRTIPDPDHREKITYTCRLILVTVGSVIFHTPDGDFTAKPGTLLYLPQACVYTSSFLSPDFQSLNVFFDFDPDRPGKERFNKWFFTIVPRAADAEKALVPEPLSFEDAPELSHVLAAETDPDLRLLTDAFQREVLRRGALTGAVAGAKITELLVYLIRCHRGTDSARTSVAFSRIEAYVQAHLDERLSGRALSDALNYHPNYMNRVVTRATGMSLHEYILREKLMKAKALLLQTDLTLTAIAQSLAFCDSGHFSRCFTAREGVPPHSFRDSMKNV